MSSPQSPRVKTIKRLFAMSGNHCAFPKCPAPLVDPDSGRVTGRVCHIKAAKEGGPRFDPAQDDEQRHGFDNLVLMCPTHHDVVDSDLTAYTVERLTEIKTAREDEGRVTDDPSDEVAAQLISNSMDYIVIAAPVAGDVVISQHQSGGQTAHTIHNYGPPKRQISPTARAEMLSILSTQRSSVGFASTQGDPEAAAFKQKLMDVFRQAGWDVRDMETFMFFGSKSGFVVTIPFGAPEQGVPQLVSEALSRTGNPVTGNRGDMANECGVYVQVWHAPT